MSDAPASDELSSAPAPSPPGGLFHLPPDCAEVLDADEEIMELYMALSAVQGPGGDSGGLGFLDARQASLELSLELAPPQLDVGADHVVGTGAGTSMGPRGRRTRTKKVKSRPAQAVTIDLTVYQDPSALRSRSGDTGSVLWRSSLHLARYLLTERLFPRPGSLLDAEALARACVLELGAGTGVLAALLAPLCGSYIATDLKENLRLVSRNVAANAGAVKLGSALRGGGGGPEGEGEGEGDGDPAAGLGECPQPGVATVQALDWAAVSAARAKHKARPPCFAAPEADGVDLVLAVDCIYNESLVGQLVDALSAVCAQGAIAWVVVELRSSDVLTLFLDTWLNDVAGWRIVRLGEGAMGTWDGHRPRWVGWVGWIEGAAEAAAAAAAAAER